MIIRQLQNPGILTLPLHRLWPFFSLWTMHVWIYWFNTTPIAAHMAPSPWPIDIYGAMTAALLAAALIFRQRPVTSPTGRYDIPMTAIMCTVTLSTFLNGTLGSSSVPWRCANIILAGICMAWGYLRWSVIFSDLGIKDAIACLFGSYVIGSSIKVAFDVTPAPIGCLLALVLPPVSTASLRLVVSWAWVKFEDRRGVLLYQRANLASLGRIAICVLVFCFVYRIVPTASSDPTTGTIGRLLGHAVEVCFALAALAWVFRLNRSLDFPQLWRFVFLFLATSIATTCLNALPVIDDLCSSVASSLIVMLLWLLLSDVAHHADLHPYVVFGIGWSLHVGGRYLGTIAENIFPIASTTALGVALLWLLGVVMVFCLETRDPDVQRIFADLRRKVDPEEFASIDERCDLVAREYGLTGREVDVLKLLAKGRSKAYIAEALVISENTVRGHARRLYAKLGVHTRDELQGLIGL